MRELFRGNFRKGKKMEITKTTKTALKFDGSVYTNTYVSSYSKNVEIDLSATDKDGVDHTFEIFMPIEKARALAKELSGDLANYDEEELKKQRQREEEAKAEAEEEFTG
tara:strand:- start:56 stop:382 length:327 start_codon:yes stop_codon:yes gene_type:complete